MEPIGTFILAAVLGLIIGGTAGWAHHRSSSAYPYCFTVFAAVGLLAVLARVPNDGPLRDVLTCFIAILISGSAGWWAWRQTIPR